MTDCIVVLTTVPDGEVDDGIAEALVNRGLAACVSTLSPIRSVYRFKGEVHRDSERLLVIKTRQERFDAVRDAIRELHPYEVPEVVALSIEQGLPEYLEWIREMTLGEPSPPLGEM